MARLMPGQHPNISCPPRQSRTTTSLKRTTKRKRPVEDIPHETEEETLSLDVKEREMILKALKKHNNKRKYAAHDLGISERTLYRKLKQYDLEQV